MIETVIDQILERITPQTDNDVGGFRIDVRHYLSVHALFSEVEVDSTSDPRCIILARAKATSEAKSLQQIADALGEVWEEIYYNCDLLPFRHLSGIA
jgi:hypothetical protein